MTKLRSSPEAPVDEQAEVVISHLSVSLSMAQYFLPQNALLANLISMALLEARRKSLSPGPRPGARGKAKSGACAIPAPATGAIGSTKNRQGVAT